MNDDLNFDDYQKDDDSVDFDTPWVVVSDTGSTTITSEEIQQTK